jgi:acetyl esterase/lipase
MLSFILATVLLASAPQDRPMLGPPDLERLPVTAPTLVEPYGSDPLQFGQLRLPEGPGPFPVAIVIHGGCWTRGFEDVGGTAPIASALTARGIATWNIEYRQLGDAGGGWPGTFQDWGAATDHLRSLGTRHPLDLDRIAVVGHSAGAHAALFIASRPTLGADSAVRGDDPLPVVAAVVVDGPADIRAMIGVDEQICGGPVIAGLFGGGPTDQAARYAEGNPAERLPLGTAQYLVASAVLPPPAAEAYGVAARAAGDRVEVVVLEGACHFNMIAPGEPSWTEVEALIVDRALAAAP